MPGLGCYVNSLMPDDITAAMREQRASCMIVVPLFLNLIRKGIETQVARQTAWRRKMFTAAHAIAPLLPRSMRRWLFRPLHARFGGALEYFVCGGAPLAPDVVRFFERVGIDVYQGYGMAEASPVIATNTISANRCGSVGKPLPGVEVKIDRRGEILTRGPQVMLGYFNNPELTRQVVDTDGWLHTGDIGYLDDDGYLYVRGRDKNLIVLANGKKVHPEELEAVLFDHPAIKEGCIASVEARIGIQTGCAEICALVVPADDLLQSDISDDELTRQLADIVRQRAARLASWKRPTRVVLSRTELPKTATRKIKRGEIELPVNGGR